MSAAAGGMRFYTTGYAGHHVEALERRMADLGAVLVDIRMNPSSRLQEWHGRSLWRRFNTYAEGRAERGLPVGVYSKLEALGNVHYKHGPIKIKDMDQGIAALELMDKPAILLCGCRHYLLCHRAVVGDALRARGHTVDELVWEEGEG